MSQLRLEIRVMPRAGLLDPEGNAIAQALHSLGFSAVADVRVGRLLMLEVDARSVADARELGEAMCQKLLANPVTQDYEVVVSEAAGAGEAR